MAAGHISRCPKCRARAYRTRQVGGSIHRPVYGGECERCGWKDGGPGEAAAQRAWNQRVSEGGIAAAVAAVAQREAETRAQVEAAAAAAREEAAERKRQRYANWPQRELWNDLGRVERALPVWISRVELSLDGYLEVAGAVSASAEFGAESFMDETPEASVQVWSLLDGAVIEQLSDEIGHDQFVVGRGFATWMGDRMGSRRRAWAKSQPAPEVLDELVRLDATAGDYRFVWSPDKAVRSSFADMVKVVHELMAGGRVRRPVPCRWIPDGAAADRWHEAGFGRWAATDYAAAGFVPEQAQRWHAFGLTASEALAQRDEGCEPGEQKRGPWTEAFVKSRKHQGVWTVRPERTVEVEERLADLACPVASAPGPWFGSDVWSWGLLDGVVVGLSDPSGVFSSGHIASGLRVVGADAMALLCLQLGLVPPQRRGAGSPMPAAEDLIDRWLERGTNAGEADLRVELGLRAYDDAGLRIVADGLT